MTDWTEPDIEVTLADLPPELRPVAQRIIDILQPFTRQERIKLVMEAQRLLAEAKRGR